MAQWRMLVLGAAADWLAASAPLQAQPVPAGPEFQVNVSTIGLHGAPSIGTAEDGGYIVVRQNLSTWGWQFEVLGRRFESDGMPMHHLDLPISTIRRGWRIQPAVGVLRSGSSVVVWQSAESESLPRSVFARRLNKEGTPLDGREFQVNTQTSNDSYGASVSVDSAGRFVVVWLRYGLGWPADGIFGRRFDRFGDPLDAQEFRVSAFTTGRHGYPSVAMDGSGNFVVVWTRQVSAHAGVVGRRFSSTGTPLDSEEFAVSTDPNIAYHSARVAKDGSGDFVVAWATYNYDEYLPMAGIFARRFASTGTPLDAQGFLVNTDTAVSQSNPSLATDDSGNLIVAWEDGGRGGVSVRRFDSAGTAVDSVEFGVGTQRRFVQSEPAVTVDDSGNLLVAWREIESTFGESNVMAQRFLCDDLDGDGLCDWDEVVLRSPLDGAKLDCTDPSSVRPTITWGAGNYDRFRVHLSPDPAFPAAERVTSGDELLRARSWRPSPKRWRAACAKALAANPGDPVMYIRVLGRDLDAPEGSPHRRTYSQTVRAAVHP